MSVREAVRLCVHLTAVLVIGVGCSDYEYIIDTTRTGETSEYPIIPIGESVTLICPNPNVRNRVTWYKATIDEYAAYSDYHGKRCIINNRKYPSIQVGPYDCSAGNFSITFPKISYSDQGQWRCHTKEFTSSFVNITVLPLWAFTTTTPSTTPTKASIFQVSLIFRRRKKGYTLAPGEDAVTVSYSGSTVSESDQQKATDTVLTATKPPSPSDQSPSPSDQSTSINPGQTSAVYPDLSTLTPHTTRSVPTVPTRDVANDDSSSIVGGVLGLIVFLLFACFLLVLLLRHRRKRPKCLRPKEEENRMQDGTADGGGRSTMAPMLWLSRLREACPRPGRKKTYTVNRPDTLLDGANKSNC